MEEPGKDRGTLSSAGPSEKEPQATTRPTAVIEFDGRTTEVGFGISDAIRRATTTCAVAVEQEGNATADKVEESSRESFPASDAPAYNP